MESISRKKFNPLRNEGCAEVIEISVKDNGPGIPDDTKDKIFQPFVSTKPTGRGIESG
ncbi:MAG: ATP-binding protein [Cryomorphaceae bacterium]